MNTPSNVITPTAGDRQADRGFRGLQRRLSARMCMWDARMHAMLAEPERGAATAEYAVVLVAATGFAAVLVAILKSDAVKTLLSNLIKQALKIG